ncbi:DUF2254 domain-containing protein [uncultured Paracoccus sp.]|uniref:DUF2254 domain-containing protein n=1 Tax=uncultured Paracoccus sp. TaxID=189685 RepID=UPI0025D670A1|nr:DUF2254 domain-containing protein [uncultured Paracoccus sp.]
MSRLRWILSRLRRTLWVRVSLYALLGFAAAILASLASRFMPWTLPIDISADAIDSLLTIIASSMLAVTTFSVSSLTSAYGSATSNATPRATTLLTQDQFVQSVLATFIGSFLFSIVGLVALKVSFYGPQGRAVLFLVTILVIVLIVLALLRWINQLTKLGRVGDTIDRVERAASLSLQARLDLPFLGGRPLDHVPPAAPVHAVCSTRIGYVDFIDAESLSGICDDIGADIDIRVLPGAFLYGDSVLAVIHGYADRADDDLDRRIRRAFSIGAARSFDQDPRFGIIAMSEIGLRSLSAAIHDSGTAIDVIGRQTRLMTLWSEGWGRAERDRPRHPRLRVPPLSHDDLFEDAFNLIARDAAGQIDIVARLLKALHALTRIGPAEARRAAERQFRIAVERADAALTGRDDRARLHDLVAGLGEPG